MSEQPPRLPGGNAPGGGPAPRDLVPRDLVRQSYRALWGARGELLRIAVAPVGIILAIDAVLFLSAPAGAAPALGPWDYLLIALSIPPGALLAVNWLRVLLLGPGSVSGLGLRWGRRETRFLLRMIVVLLAAIVATFITVAPILILVGVVVGTGGGPGLAHLLTLAAVFGGLAIYAYVGLRLSLALAAAALDAPGGMPQSWAATRGAGVRLVLAGIPVVGPFYVLMLLLPTLLLQSGVETAAPLSSLLLQVVLASLASVAGFTVVAVVYRRLGGPIPGSGVQV